MNPTELRIGNYVNVNHESHKLPPLKVIAFDCRLEITDELQYKYEHFIRLDEIQNEISDAYYSFNECKIEPIPLTKEWLLKFGFEAQSKLGQRQFFAIGNITIELCTECFAIYVCGTLIGFHNYVHQLQNLYFALTEKELKIKLENEK